MLKISWEWDKEKGLSHIKSFPLYNARYLDGTKNSSYKTEHAINCHQNENSNC